jgi:hypothetical protein
MHTLIVTSRQTTHTFTWPTATARHLIDALSRVHPYQLLGDTLSFGDIRVQCDDLSRVLHYTFDDSEADVPPSVELALMLLQPRAHKQKRKRAPVAKEKILQRRKEKIKRGSYVTINAMAQELGVKPRDCRQALRKLSMIKPDHGWAWAPSDAAIVRAKLARYLSKRVARQTPISKDDETKSVEEFSESPLQNGKDHLM